ncbi:MAG: ATP-binding cassette domain-containing protein [Alphaproteobacteria bacterium]
MFEPPIYTIKSAGLAFGNNQLFRNVEFYINRGDKICLVGRNGCGKSTLLKVIAGKLEPDRGEIFIQPGTKVAYMPQDPDFSGFATLRDVVLAGLPADEHGLEYKADILIGQLGILEQQPVASASGGEKRKAALAQALVSEPDILLLDEPTNHLDLPTIEKLEKIIETFNGAVMLISHDRMFLNNTSKTTFWLDRGVMHCNNKGFKFFEEWQEQVINQELIEQHNLNKKSKKKPNGCTKA